MNISRTQTDKLLVGSNDVSYEAPDKSPTGTAVLNGPVYVGKPSAAPEYEAALNVASNGAPQNSLDTQPAYQSSSSAAPSPNSTLDAHVPKYKPLSPAMSKPPEMASAVSMWYISR